MLENVRYDPRETSKDERRAAGIRRRGSPHSPETTVPTWTTPSVRCTASASVFDIAQKLPGYLGDLVRKEVDVLKKVISDPERPFVVVMGGSKVSDKLAVIENLIGKADSLLIGGGMVFTFLAAGYSVGGSLLEKDQIDVVKDYLDKAEAAGTEIVLPVDVVYAAAFDKDAQNEVRPVEDIG